MSDSPWHQFLEVLRQVSVLKKSGATGVALDALVEEAWDLWAELPPVTAGSPRSFPPDTFAVARELGFERSPIQTQEIEPFSIEAEARTAPPPRPAPPVPPPSSLPPAPSARSAPPAPPPSSLPPAPSAASAPRPPPPSLSPDIARAMHLQQLASAIDKAITEAGGVGDISVACSESLVVLTGIAVDEDARDNAQIIAAKLVPGVRIDNSITVA